MELLYRDPALPGAVGQGPLTPDDLHALYAWPSAGSAGPWLRANMVASVDGMARGPDGRSGSMSGQADKLVFALLRQTADAVLVGAGTASAEDYGPITVRPEWQAWRAEAGQSAAPPIVVVTNRARLDPTARLFTGARGSVLVVAGAQADPERLAALRDVAEVVTVDQPKIEARRIPALLAERGLRRILTEGGPTLLGELADVLDDLCLTTAPMLIGGGEPPRRAPDLLGGSSLARERPAELAHLALADGTLLARWLLRGAVGAV